MSESVDTKAARTASVPDVPVFTQGNEKFRATKHDTLDTYSYARALGEFIEKCDMPITVGVQGEWGSGKTSLLNMIEVFLKGQEEENKRGKRATCTIKINTWEHSLLRTPEETLLSIIREIIQEISQSNGRSDEATEGLGAKALHTLKEVGKGAIYSAVTMTAGFKVAERMETAASNIAGQGEDSVKTDKNLIKELRLNLRELVEAIENDDSPTKRFVIFVDDLDRLEPATAVQILELLKNVFDVPHTVFVLAIDYQVVVKGLKSKFGEPTEENEWEFRAFFEKIIQVPFLMPMAKYKLGNYIARLLDGIQYFSKTESKNFEHDKGVFTDIVKKTVGHNPRALKRLANSLSLIKLQSGEELKGYKDKQLLFALICFQIGFPNIFELLLLNPSFTDWKDEGAQRFIRSKGKEPNPTDFEPALAAINDASDSFFDGNEWHKALFRVVWTLKWQRQRIIEAITVLELISENILGEARTPATQAARQAQIEKAVEMAATTSVISLDTVGGKSSAEDSDGSESDKQKRREYWGQFKSHTVNSDTWSDIRDTMNSGRLIREDNVLEDMFWRADVSTTSFLRLQGTGGNVRRFFHYLDSHAGRLQNFLSDRNTDLTIRLAELDEGEHRLSLHPRTLKKRVRLPSLDKSDEQRVRALEWMEKQFEEIRLRIIGQWENFQRGSGDGPETNPAAPSTPSEQPQTVAVSDPDHDN